MSRWKRATSHAEVGGVRSGSDPQCSSLRASADSRRWDPFTPPRLPRRTGPTTLIHLNSAIAIETTDNLRGVQSAPGKIRTCDLPLRRRALYPLSYGRAGAASREGNVCSRQPTRWRAAHPRAVALPLPPWISRCSSPGPAAQGASARRGCPRCSCAAVAIGCCSTAARARSASCWGCVRLADMDCVFITHFHADHWLGLPGMLKSFALRDRERPLSDLTDRRG